ncbi:MAG: hypothetical protein R2734_10420 [Nocardioides sp.]
MTTIGALGLTTLALAVRDPHVSRSWGMCPSLAFFGVAARPAEACAVNDLTHLDVVGALSSNLYFVLLMPAAAFLLGRWLVDSTRGVQRSPAWMESRAVWWTLGVTLAVFTLARNLPMGHWLYP